MKSFFKNFFGANDNETYRRLWLKKTLAHLPSGIRILDAGARELQNKVFCTHLNYISQDICQYEGLGNTAGLQMGKWDTSRIDIVSDICNIPEPNGSFDAILCSEVFKHLSDPLSSLDEFCRLLRPGGSSSLQHHLLLWCTLLLTFMPQDLALIGMRCIFL